MHITSITVRNYRVHRELSVELHRSLTLIGGHNEAGKSTLVEAAHRALFLKHNASGEVCRSMNSTRYAGSPEVEVGFTAGMKSYRIQKRFSGTNGTALLTEENGSTWRGDEAESRLAQILGVEPVGGGKNLGERVAQQWAHLWVWQGQANKNPAALATAQKSSLLARLQGQGGAAAMQSELDAVVAALVADRTESLFNKNGSPRKDSDLGRATQEDQDAATELNQAQATLAKLQQAITDSQEADKTIQSSQADLVKVQSESAELNDQLARVAVLRGDEQTQQFVETSAVANHETLALADKKIRKMQAEIQTRSQALAPKNAETTRLQNREVESSQQAKQADDQYQQAIQNARTARLRHELATAHVNLFEKTAQRDLLLTKLQQVREVRDRLAGLEAEQAKLPVVSATKLKKLQELDSQCSSTAAALQAMAAGIEVVVSDLPVQVGRTLLDVGQPHILTEDTEITIGTATRLRIKPGGGTSLAEARQQVQEARQELQQELDTLGLSSTAEAEKSFAARQQFKSDIQAEKAHLAGLGAETIDEESATANNAQFAAEAEIQNRSALVADFSFSPPADVADARSLAKETAQLVRDAEGEESSAKSARDAVAEVLQKAINALAVHRQALQEEEQALRSLEAQLQLLLENHGEDAERSDRLTKLLAIKMEAEERLAATHHSLTELQPEMLEQDSKRLTRAMEQCLSTKNNAEMKRAGARSLLQSDGSSDPQAAVALAEARAHSAKEHRASVQRRADAIQLLHKLFLEEQHELADQFTRPFAEKITGYLQCLFGAGVSANLRLDNNEFDGLKIVRPGQGNGTFEFENLSTGAKEQMAAAVRLAMAEVLAEDHDDCLPVVFDDAFAYSDSDRVTTLQRMLDRAATQGLQIIVLSCNPSDYAALGAKAITLTAEPTSHQLPPSEQPAAINQPSDDFMDSPDDSPAPTRDVSDSQREALISALRLEGGPKGNLSLRQSLGWDAATYDSVKNDLVASGHLIPGRGRGGSVTLADSENP